jgi:hypothetical protein
MALSDNGLKLGIEAIKALVIIVPIVVPLFIQQRLQHNDRMAIEEKAIVENNERLDKVAAEVKATQRPLVFGGKE